MLASRHSPEDVVKIMEDNPFVIEQKFDGERVQVHKNGKEIRLYSRFVCFVFGSCAGILMT